MNWKHIIEPLTSYVTVRYICRQLFVNGTDFTATDSLNDFTMLHSKTVDGVDLYLQRYY